MTFIGNLVLVIASIIFFGLSSVLFSRQAPPSGDYAVGYAWTLIIGNFAFMICMAIVTAIIGAKGGFSWVNVAGAPRFWVVFAGFVLAMIGHGFFAMNEGMGPLSSTVRQVLRYAPAVIPVLLLLSAAFLLNDSWRSAVPVAIYKWPLLFTVGMGLFALGLIMAANARNATAQMEAAGDFEKRNQQNHLDMIDSTDVMRAMTNILVFTDANHSPGVRERALAKIKSRPDWQEELVRNLSNNAAPEVFTFLASNQVDNKAMFAEPVKEGLLVQARLIRENIRHCRDTYDLYPGRFSWEVERVLRTLQQFSDMGVDYRPAVQEIRNALDERTSFERPTLQCAAVLDKWIKKH